MILRHPITKQKSRVPQQPPCSCCGAHEGHAWRRGVDIGIRLLADALRRGDLAAAQNLLDLAERRRARR